MKKMLLIVLVVLLSVGVSLSAGTNFTKTYNAKNGVVTFNHGVHSSKDKCISCHTELDSFGGVVNKDFGHKVCKSCHRSSGLKSAPTFCTGCHKK